MEQELPKRKPTSRLRCFYYKGQYAYSITICTYNDSPIFRNGRVVKMVLESLFPVCSREQFRILAYCFMSDHLHLLLAGEEKSDLVKTMKSFKQISSYRFRKVYRRSLWQRGYYDHVLRKDEDIEKVARYIWANPVRRNLSRTIEEYPFSGPRESLTDSYSNRSDAKATSEMQRRPAREGGGPT